jgi:diguanylate cyclase (GGDEF)-like protein
MRIQEGEVNTAVHRNPANDAEFLRTVEIQLCENLPSAFRLLGLILVLFGSLTFGLGIATDKPLATSITVIIGLALALRPRTFAGMPGHHWWRPVIVIFLANLNASFTPPPGTPFGIPFDISTRSCIALLGLGLVARNRRDALRFVPVMAFIDFSIAQPWQISTGVAVNSIAVLTLSGSLSYAAAALLERLRFSEFLQKKKLWLEGRVDTLSGLGNRRYFNEVTRSISERTSTPDEENSLMIFDIDHFKRVNDSFGHDTGDLVLKEVAKRIRSQLRSTDIVARWGGEEFIVFMPNSNSQSAVKSAERIRDAVAKDFISIDLGPRIELTLSAGVTTATGGTRFEDILSCADQALYAAKSQGRNRVVCFDENLKQRNP